MLKLQNSIRLAQNECHLWSWISEGNKKAMSSKRLNIKEQRSLRKGMAMGDIAMARGVCAL